MKEILKFSQLIRLSDPKEIHERPPHAAKVTVWFGITSSRIIGPYIFEEVNGDAVTVNGNRY